MHPCFKEWRPGEEETSILEDISSIEKDHQTRSKGEPEKIKEPICDGKN